MAAIVRAAVTAAQVVEGGEDYRRPFPVKVLALAERALFSQEFHTPFMNQKLSAAPARPLMPGVRKPLSKYSRSNRFSSLPKKRTLREPRESGRV